MPDGLVFLGDGYFIAIRNYKNRYVIVRMLMIFTNLFLSDVFTRSGSEHFDYLISQQHDDLIDEDRLRASFWMVFDKFGLSRKKDT